MAEKWDHKLVSWETGAVGFNSTWRDIKKSFSQIEIQTDVIKVVESNIQCIASSTKSVQTEEDLKITEVREIQQPYPPSLFAFFTKVTDEMCKCLKENLDPFAIEVFKEGGESDGEMERGKAHDNNLFNDVKREFVLRDTDIPNGVGGSCISWNKSGNQVAIGHAYQNHNGFCSHRLPISMWNISRTLNFNANQPHAQIYLPDCATSIEFHPIHPSIAAVGLWSGHIAIVDFSSSEANQNKDEDTLENSRGGVASYKKNIGGRGTMDDLGYFIERSGHSHSITAIQWLKLNSSESSKLFKKNKYASHSGLLTAAKDGFICLWSANTSNTRLTLEKKFVIWMESLPQEVPFTIRHHLSGATKALTILHLSSCANDPFAFVFATVAGFSFQGSLDSNIEAYSAMSELAVPGSTPESIYDPCLVYLRDTNGYPISIECSPFHRNIYLSATGEGYLSVHNILDSKKTLVEFSLENESGKALSDAKWSTRPTMIAVAHENSVNLYNLTLQDPLILKLPHQDNVSKIAFNKAQKGTIGTCDIRGTLYIWHLPPILTSQDVNEHETLLNLGKHL